MGKYLVPDELEKEIMRRNGIDPEGKMVFLRTEDAIYLLNNKTRDNISIHRGDKKW